MALLLCLALEPVDACQENRNACFGRNLVRIPVSSLHLCNSELLLHNKDHAVVGASLDCLALDDRSQSNHTYTAGSVDADIRPLIPCCSQRNDLMPRQHCLGPCLDW